VKLLISVINRDDTYPLLDALVDKEYQATVISTMGGFLREGNATLLIGVQDEQVPEVLALIEANCHARVRYVSPFPPVLESEGAYMSPPMEIQVGGAVVFMLDLERFEKY
jgi:uncharacterized protein YaaQ